MNELSPHSALNPDRLPRPFTVGVAYAHGFIPWLAPEAHDVPLDAVLNEDGVQWMGGPSA